VGQVADLPSWQVGDLPHFLFAAQPSRYFSFVARASTAGSHSRTGLAFLLSRKKLVPFSPSPATIGRTY
jgi:hypothetical protein